MVTDRCKARSQFPSSQLSQVHAAGITISISLNSRGSVNHNNIYNNNIPYNIHLYSHTGVQADSMECLMGLVSLVSCFETPHTASEVQSLPAWSPSCPTGPTLSVLGTF